MALHDASHVRPHRFGHEIPDGVYSTRDFGRVVSLLVRTELTATHLSAILRKDPTARVMVFCVDQQHAEDMRRALIVADPDLVANDPEWVARIVGSEPDKMRLLEAYTDPESGLPVVATTSRLLSTGVDVEDLKFVVLLRPSGSMVEFEQIIGRGTRLYPPKGKTSFVIISTSTPATAQRVLGTLLDRYAVHGIDDITSGEVLSGRGSTQRNL